MDVHKDSCQVTCLEPDGRVLDRCRISNTFQSLDQWSRGLQGKAVIALEASTASRAVYRQLQGLGHEMHLANPNKLRLVAESKRKTDEEDSDILAQMLRMGYLPECYVPDVETQQLRALVRHRVRLGQKMTAAKNQVHALLTGNGIRQRFSDLFGTQGMRFLEQMELPWAEQRALESHLREIGFLREEMEALDSELARIAEKDPRAELLMSMPGIGYYSALAILSEIGDIRRFPDAKKLAAYAGLAPSVRQSGETAYRGRITKEGPAVLRWILVSDAHSAIRKEGKLRRFYLRLEKRVGKNKAVVATARKMLTIIYHMLVENRPYEEREEDVVYQKRARMRAKARKRPKGDSARSRDLLKKGVETVMSDKGALS